MRKPSRNVFYSAMTKLSRKIAYLAVTTSLTCHDSIELKSLLLDREDASYSAMTKPSRKVLYSAAATSPTWA